MIMKKLKKSKLQNKSSFTDKKRNTLSKPQKKRSTKGEVYRARHNYEQTYLEINRKGRHKRTYKDVDESHTSEEKRERKESKAASNADARAGSTRRNKKTKSKKGTDELPSLPFTKVQRRKLHNKAMKELQKEKLREKDNEKELDFTRFRDEVKFGEVVSAPPQLTAKPRGTAPISNKPGQRGLLLKALLAEKSPTTTAGVDLKSTKRKLLAPGQRRIIEMEQQRVVDAYRRMKKNKTQL